MTYLTDKAALDALPERRFAYGRRKPFEWTDQEAVEEAVRELLAESPVELALSSGSALQALATEIAYIDTARRRVARDILAKAAQKLLYRAVDAALIGPEPTDGKLCQATGYGTCGTPYKRHAVYKAKMTIDGRAYCKRDGEKALDTAAQARAKELAGRSNVVGLDREPDELQAYIENVAMLTSPAESAELLAAVDEYGSKWGALVGAES